MSKGMRVLIAVIGLGFVINLLSTIGFAAEKRALNVEDLWAMKRITEMALSPDGAWIAFTQVEYDMAGNSANADIYLLATKDKQVRRLTDYAKYDGAPQWRPDSKALAIISTRDTVAQIYLLEIPGGEIHKLSSVPTGVNSFSWSPNGNYLLFTSTIHPEAKDLKESARLDEEGAKATVKARLIDRLLYRHWNQWTDGKRSHVFLLPVAGGEIRDATPGDFDTPPIALGSSHDFTFSPDSKEIAFVRNEDPEVAISTDNDIFAVPTTDGEIRRLTENPANDNQPVYSPDGHYLAYHAMARAGFEADQYDLMLYDRTSQKTTNLTSVFDLDVDEILWSPQSDKIYFNSENQGRISVFSVDIKKGTIKEIIHDHQNQNLAISPDGNTLYFRRQAANLPYEIFSYDLKKHSEQQLTFVNRALLAQLAMNPLEEFWFQSYDGHRVHGVMVKPPSFTSNKKYPLVYLIHGGPQGSWGDDFHYRWNSQMFAASGYVVVMVNFRGSKGYGQWFCDQVSRDWGGGPYQDLMFGLNYLLQNFAFIDSSKLAAAGASYGGFMIDWIAGQANTSPANRFKCLVSHDGVFDQFSMYGGTEELWFPEWEFGGTPYDNPELYDKWSASRYAKNFKIPTLVIHSENDFRVPVTQGLQFFTALQRQGVPSKLLYFPDEDHFISKPQNARLWWQTVMGWIDEWVNP